MPGTNYYRLKQVDIDGRESVSEVRTVEFDLKNLQVSVYPNPANNIIKVKGNALIIMEDCNADRPPTNNKIMANAAINTVQNKRCHVGEFSVLAVR